jgi:FtsH-binding integral membrane protein
MGTTLIVMALAAALLAAQLAAVALFREVRVAVHVAIPVAITVAALALGLTIGDRDGRPLDLTADTQWLQAVAALVGTVLLTGLSLFFLKPRYSQVTLMRALTIGLAATAAMLGAVRLWATMVV